VRLVNLSGDRLAPDDLRALFRLLPEGAAVLYGYGSTETNLVAQGLFTRGALDGLDDPGGVVPVGRPVEGKTVLLLGDDGVARGTSEGSCEGEVLVGGAFVAPCYWNRPDATRE